MRAGLVILLLLTAACAQLRPPPPSPYVTRTGETLTRHGVPFRFIGVNCFELAECPDRADEIFSTLAAASIRVVRFWAFQRHCGPTGRDFTAFEHIMAAAKRYDILLVPVLENHWEHCTYSSRYRWKPASWYARGWRREKFAGAPLSYREYITAVAAHFRYEPQILAWQLINEPEIYPDTRASFTTLYHFARDAAQTVKEADPHHLVSLGLLGVGQPGTTGQRFRALHDLPELDLVTAHDHGYCNEPLAGQTWPRMANSFYADLRDAHSLDKPFLATESGIALEWVAGDRARRAELFRAKLRAFFAAGGSGYILWNYEPESVTDYGFGPADPILPMVRETAAALSLD